LVLSQWLVHPRRSKSFGADFARALVLENPAATIEGLPPPSSRETSREMSQKFLGKSGAQTPLTDGHVAKPAN